MSHKPEISAAPDRGVVVIDEDGEAHVFETFETAARTFRGAGFRNARLLGDDASARLRSLLDMPAPPVSPDEAPKALMARIRAFARTVIPTTAFPDMGATVENGAVQLTLAALESRKLDDHGEIFGLLRRTYDAFDPEICAELYELIAEDALRLAANERQAAEDEADDHEADETALLHTTREGRAA